MSSIMQLIKTIHLVVAGHGERQSEKKQQAKAIVPRWDRQKAVVVAGSRTTYWLHDGREVEEVAVREKVTGKSHCPQEHASEDLFPTVRFHLLSCLCPREIVPP